MIWILSEHSEVVQEDLHKDRDALGENLHYDHLECCWAVLRPNTPLRYEGSLFLVFFRHAYLVVPTEAVKEYVHFVARDCIQQFVCEWEGKRVIDSYFIKLPVVDTHS
mgnify:CR=1 FL=1